MITTLASARTWTICPTRSLGTAYRAEPNRTIPVRSTLRDSPSRNGGRNDGPPDLDELWRDFNRTVGEGTVRSGMFSLMVLVEANPGIAQVDLARVLDQDKATIVGLIDSLQKRRWLVRRRSSVDARRHGIFMTATGKAGLQELRDEMLEHEARFTRLFSDDEMTMLITLLRRIHP